MSKNKGSPIEGLKDLKKKLAVEEREKDELVRRERAAEQKKQLSRLEESELLARAMAGVKPLGERPAPRPKAKPPYEVKQPLIQSQDDEDEWVLQELQGMVDGHAPLDYTASDEHIEGKSRDCSRLDLGKLRNGDFAVQGHIDLHGKNREEAKAELLKFFPESIRLGHRCVLVISGRGLRSPGGKPVLKELLIRWLVQGQLSHYVLAFASAKPHDGGVGAVYVLLRRHPKNAI